MLYVFSRLMPLYSGVQQALTPWLPLVQVLSLASSLKLLKRRPPGTATGTGRQPRHQAFGTWALWTP